MSKKIKEVEGTEDVIAEEAEETVDEAAVEQLISKEVEKNLSALTEKISGDMVEAYDKQVSEARAKAFSGESQKRATSFDKEAYGEFAKNIRSKQGAYTFDVDFDAVTKAVAPMGLDASVTGEYPQAELDPVISRDPQREPFIEELVTVGTISSNLDAWIETTDEEGDPLPVAELAAISPKDYDYARKTAEVKKIGVTAKHSAELAEDLPALESEIRTQLVRDLRRVIDTQILSGAGTGENLKGILTTATAFDAGDLEGTVENANHFDVIEAAVTQVINGLHNPSHVILHPTDVARLHLAKGEDGHYVLPPFSTADGRTISGVRVVRNTGIAAGSFLVGDFSKSTVKYRRGVTVEVSNTDADDFSKDRFTTKATARLVHRVRENDYGAFVKGTFAAAITALTPEVVE